MACQSPAPAPAEGIGKRLLNAGMQLAENFFPMVGVAKGIWDTLTGGGGGGGGENDWMADCLNANYEAIQANGAAIERNAEAIAANAQAIAIVESKVDEVYEELKESKKELLEAISETTVKPIISNLKMFLSDFQSKSAELKSLREDELIIRLERPEGFMHFLKELIKPSVGTLHGRLNDILHQNLAVPKDADDRLAFSMLFMLINGAVSYVSVLNILNEQYTILVKHYYAKGDLEAYNRYIKLRYDVYKDKATALIADQSGLFDRIVALLDTVKRLVVEDEHLLGIITASRDDFKALKQTISDQIKSQVVEVPKRITINLNFKDSKIKTPAGEWRAGRKVSYAIIYRDETTGQSTILSKWSTPYKVSSKACPVVKIPLDTKKRTRIIFRQFDKDPPQLVATVAVHNQTSFVDIDRDAFNAASESNEEQALLDIEPFVANGANINAPFYKQRTPLHMAAANGNLNLARYLLQHGARTDVLDRNGYTPLHNAAYKDERDFVQAVLDEDLMEPNVLSSHRNTPLHSAVIGGNSGMIEVLLSSNKTDITLQNIYGLSALHLAAMNGNEDLVETFLGSSQINATINTPSKSGFTALHFAISGKHEGVALKLIESEYIDINLRDGVFFSAPLHLAAAADQTEVVSALLEKGALVDVRGQDNQTPLHVAISNQRPAVAALLLEKGADVTIRSTDAKTPMHLVAKYYDASLMSSLIRYGAPVNFPDGKNQTPLYLALKNGNAEAVKGLMSSCGRYSFHSPNGKSMLYLAVQNNDTEVVAGLIKLGLDVNEFYTDRAEDSPKLRRPIDVAFSEGYLEMMDILLEGGAKFDFFVDLNAKQETIDETLDQFDLTESGSLQVIELLKKHKLDYKVTFLLFACRSGYVELLESLMDNNFGYRVMACLNQAIRYSQTAVVKLLASKYRLDLMANLHNILTGKGEPEKQTELFKYIGEQQKYPWVTIINEKRQWFVHLAAMKNNLPLLKYVLECSRKILEYQYQNVLNSEAYIKANLVSYVNPLDSSGRTPLMLALEKDGDVEVVEYLLSLDANVEQANAKKQTPVYAAAKKGKLAALKLLVAKAADLVNETDSKGVSPLAAAIEHDGDIELVKYLVEAKADLSWKRKKTKESLVNLAVKEGKHEIVKYLLEQKVEYVPTEFYTEEWNVLQEAAYRGSLELVQFALKEAEKDKKELELIQAKDSEGRNAAHCALLDNKANLDVMKILLTKGIDINSTNGEGVTLLQRAILSENTDIAVHLLEAGAKYTVATLETAVSEDNLLIAQELLARRVDANGKDSSGEPLLLGVKSLPMLRLLIEYGADAFAKNTDGQTVFELALKDVKTSASSQDIVRYYIFDYISPSGRTVLHELTHNLAAIKFATEHGGNVNERDAEKRTPLHAAIQANSTEVVDYLLGLDSCVDLQVKDRANETVIGVAKRLEQQNTVQLLEKHLKKRTRRSVSEVVPSESHFSQVLDSVAHSIGRLTSRIVGYLPFVHHQQQQPSQVQSPLHSVQLLPHHSNPQAPLAPAPLPAPFEVNSTLLLVDVLTRKVTGQAYIPRLDYSQTNRHNARGYALAVVEHFEKHLDMIAKQLDTDRRHIDAFSLFQVVERLAVKGQFSEIEDILKKKAEEVYPELNRM